MCKVSRTGLGGWRSLGCEWVVALKSSVLAVHAFSSYLAAACVCAAMSARGSWCGRSPDNLGETGIMATLDQLKLGQTAKVEAIDGQPALVQRLFELGLLEGEQVEVLALAPFGDPIEIRCGDSRLSLRRHEAAGIRVFVQPAQ
jgi:ferrous iron transport protein A